ncbi:MAG: hypothetical protein JWP88_1008 [Flaviaesturariibacter sp.]|nr:hypothetical protein [Flaviaesturariibacter sp.]
MRGLKTQPKHCNFRHSEVLNMTVPPATPSAFIQQNLVHLFSQAPAPIAIYKGRELVYEFVNDAYSQIFHGREIVGKPLRQAFPELEGQPYFDILEAVFDTGVPYTAHETPALIDLEGNGRLSTRYYNLVYTPYKNEAGFIEGVMAFGHDVTDQVEARQKEAQTETRFRNLVEQSPDPILILKGEELVLDVANTPLLKLWNVTESAIGKPFLEILPEMKEQGFHDLLLSVYRQGQTHYGYEHPVYFHRGGEKALHYFNFVYQPYREPNGAVSGVLILAHDVTAQVMATQQVFESEERLRIALDSADMGTWETLPESDTLYFSDRCKELFGFAKDATITKKEADAIIADADKARVAAAIKAALQPASGGRYNIEYGIIHLSSGELRTIRASGKVFFAEGIAQRFIGTVTDITAEVKRREEQQKLFTLVDNSVELMSVLELSGKNSYINKAGMQLLGFDTFQQVLDTPITDLHTPEDIAFVEANVLPSVMQNGRWSGSMNVRHIKTGEVFPVYNNTIRIDDPATGEPMAIGAVMRDMRPELAAQRALAESEANLRNMILQSPVAMCILMGSDYRVEIANDHMFELWGKKGEEVLDKPIFEGLPEAKGQGLEDLLYGVFNTGERFMANELPVNLPRAGQVEAVYINFVYEPFRGGSGEIKGIIAAAIDVTNQVIARQKIEYAEERARLAIDSANMGAYEINLLNNDMHTSDRFKAIWGYDFDLNRAGYASVIHPEDQPVRAKAHQDSLTTGQVAYEARVIWKDGSQHWVKVAGKVFFDENGVPQKLLGVIQDITEQKRFADELAKLVHDRTKELQEANLRLQQTNAELEQFAYVSSHDLQEPLRKIRMFAGMIRERDFSNLSDYSKGRFDKITDAAQRMSNSLTDLLNFSSLSKEEQFSAVNLNEVIEAVCTDLELAIAQKGATISYSGLPDALPAIPLQMQQLFYNLLNNALKFSDPSTPPVISVTAKRLPLAETVHYPQLQKDRSYHEIVVKDNGIGFRQDTADKIFLLFQRLHDRQTYSGTGIGLALCKKVADNHGGHIFAVSAPGEGAAFHILLPETR